MGKNKYFCSKSVDGGCLQKPKNWPLKTETKN